MPEPNEILNRIHQLQSTGDAIYRPGLFPSQRIHTLFPYCREDNNIFFSALIAFTLQGIKKILQSHLGTKADEIVEKICSNYPYFKSDKGTYNFWEPGKQHFPNGSILHRLDHMAIPDDTDDCALILLTGNPTREEVQEFKERLESHYAPDAPLSPSTLPAYRDLRAYPTFFGKKMLREMDACVISNMLLLVYQYGLRRTAMDLHSIEYLKRALIHGDYRYNSFLISPNYQNPAIILYHIARLVGINADEDELVTLKASLVEHLKLELDGHPSFMDRLLLKSSLARLNVESSLLATEGVCKSDFDGFHFFQAGLLTGFQKAWLMKVAGNSFFHLKYVCEAFCWTLLLEYQVLLTQTSDQSRS